MLRFVSRCFIASMLVACSAGASLPSTTTAEEPTLPKVTPVSRSSKSSPRRSGSTVAPTTYGEAWCAWLFDCNPVAANAFTDVGSCAVQKDAAVSPLIDAHGTGVTQDTQLACVSALFDASCADRPEDVAACQFAGKLPLEAICFADAQCTSRHCERDSDGCGSCAEPVRGDARKQTGESGCSDTACAKATDLCIEDVCQPELPTGSACALSATTSQDPCAASRGDECIAGQCTSTLPTLHVGDDCVADPQLGCANSFCNDAGNTGATNTCVPFLDEGDACTLAGQPCGGLMRCVASVCTVTTIAPAHVCR